MLSLIYIYNLLTALPKSATAMSTPPVDNLAENPISIAKKVKKIGGTRILPNNYAKGNYLFSNDFILKAPIQTCQQWVNACFRAKVKIFRKCC